MFFFPFWKTSKIWYNEKIKGVGEVEDEHFNRFLYVVAIANGGTLILEAAEKMYVSQVESVYFCSWFGKSWAKIFPSDQLRDFLDPSLGWNFMKKAQEIG